MSPIASVVGVGLASPAGFGAADHVFFVRAGLVQPAPSPFLDANEEPLPCNYCSWLDGAAPLKQRIEQLALSAGVEALKTKPAVLRKLHLSLVTSAPVGAFSESDAIEIASRLRHFLEAGEVTRFVGAAGAHEALAEAAQRLATGKADAVCIIGADSRFSVPMIAAAYRRRSVVWTPLEPPPSEAAAAVLLVPSTARDQKPLATLLGAMTTQGTSHDSNDEAVDGVGLTYLFRKLPNCGGVPMVFGPLESERLRQREWQLASARARQHLGRPYDMKDVEMAIGQVGAAAGVVHLAYAVACNRYRTVSSDIPPGSPFYTWAISRDGVRGMAILAGAVK